MKKISVLVLSAFPVIAAYAQTPVSKLADPTATVTEAEPYGKVSIADLQLTSCEFEPDANAEILFDKGTMFATGGLNTEHHIRIKIFNASAEKEANVRLYYNTEIGGPGIADLEAETINLVDGEAMATVVPKKSIYTEKVSKQVSAVVFTFPDVKAGSVIEYKYKSDPSSAWFFQHRLPTRYSEIEMDYLDRREMRYVSFIKQPLAKYDIDKKAVGVIAIGLANVHSLPVEPYMSSIKDNSQRVEFYSTNIRINSWGGVVFELSRFKRFANALYGSLPGEGDIKKHAKSLELTDEKIAYIFDTVKNTMKWNGVTNFYSDNEINQSWSQKTGNSGEINLVLYHLLKVADIKAYPMLISTRDHGKIIPANPNPASFNSLVVYVPVDNTKHYVLDASGKFNQFNTIPFDDLNTYGLDIDIDQEKYRLVPLLNEDATMQTLFINANIQADGKINGTAEITNESYGKITAVNRFETLGEEAYRASLQKGDNVKISGLRMNNMESDTLPLIQHFDFSADLPGSDENYIYFKPDLFSQIEENPFASENRYSDIDLGYRNNYSITCTFKEPPGYRVDALAKSVTIIMPDESIVFKRFVAEDNGTILIRYTIVHKKTLYLLAEYQDIRGFYKKMYDLLNEQISLKKM